MPKRRPRGYQPQWKPRARTCDLLAAVDRVLARYVAQLPLTIRQVWYSLISNGVLVKEERTYKQTVELLGMARRSGRILWEALRDDTEIRAEPVAYDGPDGFRAGLRQAALDYRLDNGLPAKRGAALRAAADGHRAVRVFVVSDWDQSGVHLFSALAEDVTAFAAVDAPGTEVVFERLAVTEQQIADYQLPTAPPKASDHRSFSGTSTTQAEALPPDVLAAVLKVAITAHRDMRVLAALLEREDDERRHLLQSLGYDPDAD